MGSHHYEVVDEAGGYSAVCSCGDHHGPFAQRVVAMAAAANLNRQAAAAFARAMDGKPVKQGNLGLARRMRKARAARR